MRRATDVPPEEQQFFTVVDEEGWCFRRPYPPDSSKSDHKGVHCSVGNCLYLVVDWQDVPNPDYCWNVEWEHGVPGIAGGETLSLAQAKLDAEVAVRRELTRLVEELGGKIDWIGRMLDCTKKA